VPDLAASSTISVTAATVTARRLTRSEYDHRERVGIEIPAGGGLHLNGGNHPDTVEEGPGRLVVAEYGAIG
jgi:hypothetical protein